jgi:hypothetical protein
MMGYVVAASADGHFRATVPLRPGTNVIRATTTSGARAPGVRGRAEPTEAPRQSRTVR